MEVVAKTLSYEIFEVGRVLMVPQTTVQACCIISPLGTLISKFMASLGHDVCFGEGIHKPLNHNKIKSSVNIV